MPASRSGGPLPVPMATMLADAGREGALDYLLAVGVELVAVEVAVGVD